MYQEYACNEYLLYNSSSFGEAGSISPDDNPYRSYQSVELIKPDGLLSGYLSQLGFPNRRLDCVRIRSCASGLCPCKFRTVIGPAYAAESIL